MKIFKKSLFSTIIALLLITFTTYVSATNIENTTTSTTSSSKVSVFELVKNTSATLNIEDTGKFEKKVVDFDETEKSITLELSLTNTAEKSEDQVKPSELFLVIDNSKSMSENKTDAGITRKQAVLDSASTLAENLLKVYPELKIGIVSFSSTDGKEGTIEDAHLEQALTNSQSEITEAIQNIKATAGIRTNIEAGLTVAEQNFSSEDNTKVLVLLSDGVPNNDIQGDFASYSGEVAKNTKAKLQSISNSGIHVISSMIGLSEELIEPSTNKTYKALSEEIFGTPENPTVGQFYYVSDSQIEETIKETIYNSLVPSEETTLKNVVIKDYFPQEIIDNFNFEYVASPNIGNVTPEVDKTDNSITWNIEVLNEGEVAKLQYKLTLKDTFNSSIIDQILPTNEKVDITYNDNGHVTTEESPEVRLNVENVPANNVNTDNTVANTPIPQTGIGNSITTLFIIGGIAIAIAVIGTKLNKFEKKQ